MIKKYKTLFLFILLTIFGLFYLYTSQNKYNMPDKTNLQFLVNCEVFPDVLYTPKELQTTPMKPITSWIGEYANFSAFHKDGSGMGSATYRILAVNNNNEQQMALYLQEPFSKTKIYINGEKIDEHNVIQDYFITFEAQKENEIIIQTTNTTHYYSGLYYPIAFGTVEDVHQLMIQRALFYGFLCFTSLTLGVYNIFLWLHNKRHAMQRMHKYFGLLSLTFCLYCLYPFSKMIGLPSNTLTYALEDGTMMLSIAFFVQILFLILHRTSRWVLPITYGMCINAILIPLCILPNLPDFISIYSFLITLYKLLISLYIVYTSLHTFKKTNTNNWLAYGCVFYALCLLAQMITLGSFEPIRFGWYEEFGVFGLILCFAKLMMDKSHEMLQQNEQLKEHLQEEVQVQTQQIEQLLIDRQQLLAQMLHDLKKTMSTANLYIQLLKNKREDTMPAQEELKVIERKYMDMMKQIKQLQEFNHTNSERMQMAPMDIQLLLKDFHEKYAPDCDALGLYFEIHNEERAMIQGDSSQLERVFQNLLFNSFEHTPMGKNIRILTQLHDSHIQIIFQDEGDGIANENIAHIFERSFTTKEGSAHSGLGLYIVKSILVMHHGEICVQSTIEKGTSFYITLPLL